jgi:RING-type zinc-finger
VDLTYDVGDDAAHARLNEPAHGQPAACCAGPLQVPAQLGAVAVSGADAPTLPTVEPAGDQAQDLAEANQCCICMEPWDASGPRRVLALQRCGHLFCKECIMEYVNRALGGHKCKCPTCRKEFSKKHLVPLVIHGLHLAGPDVVELQRAKREKEQLQKDLTRLKVQQRDLEEQTASANVMWSQRCRCASPRLATACMYLPPCILIQNHFLRWR